MNCPHCNSSIPPVLLPINRAAKYYNINYNTLRIYAWQGRIPTVKLGRRRYINTRAFEKWINDHTVLPDKRVVRFGEMKGVKG